MKLPFSYGFPMVFTPFLPPPAIFSDLRHGVQAGVGAHAIDGLSGPWGAMDVGQLLVEVGGHMRQPQQVHWIGLRENFNRKAPYLMGKSMVSCKFSLKPIHWWISWVAGVGYKLLSIDSIW